MASDWSGSYSRMAKKLIVLVLVPYGGLVLFYLCDLFYLFLVFSSTDLPFGFNRLPICIRLFSLRCLHKVSA